MAKDLIIQMPDTLLSSVELLHDILSETASLSKKESLAYLCEKFGWLALDLVKSLSRIEKDLGGCSESDIPSIDKNISGKEAIALLCKSSSLVRREVFTRAATGERFGVEEIEAVIEYRRQEARLEREIKKNRKAVGLEQGQVVCTEDGTILMTMVSMEVGSAIESAIASGITASSFLDSSILRSPESVFLRDGGLDVNEDFFDVDTEVSTNTHEEGLTMLGGKNIKPVAPVVSAEEVMNCQSWREFLFSFGWEEDNRQSIEIPEDFKTAGNCRDFDYLQSRFKSFAFSIPEDCRSDVREKLLSLATSRCLESEDGIFEMYWTGKKFIGSLKEMIGEEKLSKLFSAACDRGDDAFIENVLKSCPDEIKKRLGSRVCLSFSNLLEIAAVGDKVSVRGYDGEYLIQSIDVERHLIGVVIDDKQWFFKISSVSFAH